MSETITYTPLATEADAYKKFSLRQNGPNSWVRSVVKCQHQSMTSSYSVIDGESCFIFGTNNLIIGSNNIISGQANLVIGENNTFVSTDFYPQDNANIYYKLDPKMVAEKIHLSQLYDDSSNDSDSDDGPIPRIQTTILSYMQNHLNKIVADSLPRVTPRRNVARLAARRDEPYQVRPDSPDSIPAKLNAIVQLVGKWFSTYLAISSDAIKPGHFQMQHWFLDHLGSRFSTGDSFGPGLVMPGMAPFIRIIIPLEHGHGNTHSLPGDLLFLSLLQGLMNQESERPQAPPPSALPEKIPDEPDATESEAKCILCCKRSVKTVIIPCGHSYSCVDCCHNPNLKQMCAICNKPFTNIIRMYSSGDSASSS